jgi:hypothetical protein
MKKIIILRDTCDTHIDLLSYFKKLFPECEIQVLTCRPGRIEEGIITESVGYQP